MNKIPFEVVTIEVHRILEAVAKTSSYEEACKYWDQYQFYLEACGWTDSEYDQEFLKRIDSSWETNWN